MPRKGSSYLGVSDGGCQAINMQPARRLGGTRQTGDFASLGSWAEPAVCGWVSLAAHGDGYLATSPTFASFD